jgi:hypothetical protein
MTQTAFHTGVKMLVDLARNGADEEVRYKAAMALTAMDETGRSFFRAFDENGTAREEAAA